MKAGSEHRVPLSTAAMAVLGEVRQIADHTGRLFPSVIAVTSRSLRVDPTILGQPRRVESHPFHAWERLKESAQPIQLDEVVEPKRRRFGVNPPRDPPPRGPGAHRAAGRGLRCVTAPATHAGLPQVAPGRKLAYIGNHWDGLRVVRTDGRVEMDNNVVENAIRPMALNRTNALFVRHGEGAAAWARIATLTETAKMNGVNPNAYLKATLEAIANGHPASQIDQLIPWP